MSPALPSPALLAVAGVFALLAIAFAVAGWRSLRRGRVLALGAHTLSALLLVALGALCLVLVGATQGYRALTREEIACEVRVEPTGGQSFRAHFVFPDGHETVQSLKGDQLYVDAHITQVEAMGQPARAAHRLRARSRRRPLRLAGRRARQASDGRLDRDARSRSTSSTCGGATPPSRSSSTPTTAPRHSSTFAPPPSWRCACQPPGCWCGRASGSATG